MDPITNTTAVLKASRIDLIKELTDLIPIDYELNHIEVMTKEGVDPDMFTLSLNTFTQLQQRMDGNQFVSFRIICKPQDHQKLAVLLEKLLEKMNQTK